MKLRPMTALEVIQKMKDASASALCQTLYIMDENTGEYHPVTMVYQTERHEGQEVFQGFVLRAEVDDGENVDR